MHCVGTCGRLGPCCIRPSIRGESGDAGLLWALTIPAILVDDPSSSICSALPWIPDSDEASYLSSMSPQTSLSSAPCHVVRGLGGCIITIILLCALCASCPRSLMNVSRCTALSAACLIFHSRIVTADMYVSICRGCFSVRSRECHVNAFMLVLCLPGANPAPPLR